MRVCSIYMILNKLNNKCYIGSSVNMDQRIKRHFSELRKNRHYNGKLQCAFNKYEESSFVVSKIDECFESERASVESMWIDKMQAASHGYNIAVEAMSVRGTKQSDQHVANRMASRRGYKHSLETRDKLSVAASRRGGADHLHTAEVRAKAGASLKGKKHSAESKLKMSLSAKVRQAPSTETLLKRSLSMKKTLAEKKLKLKSFK